MKELCHSCKKERLNECKFEVGARKIANSVPPLDRQTLLTKGNSITSSEAVAASWDIATMRTFAVLRGCLYYDKVDPDYPGKRNL